MIFPSHTLCGGITLRVCARVWTISATGERSQRQRERKREKEETRKEKIRREGEIEIDKKRDRGGKCSPMT
jgi:hypothetical protein